jgi:cell division protein FtsQ
MDRSFAAPATAPRRRSRTPAGAGRSRWGARARAARRAPAGAWRALAQRRRLRTTLICAIVALPLLGGGWLWLRHSSLVAVEHVTITGVHGPQAREIETALRDAAKGESTLAASSQQLQAAIRRFPAVAAVHAIPSFPHGMRIEVTQQPAVAALLVGGTRTAVSRDGLVLGTALLSASLPTVADDVAPGPGSRVRNVLVRDALTVLGAAPHQLAPLAQKAYFGPRGLTVEMRNGLLVYFGDDTRPHAKWLALASVLADEGSAGATYVDVRLPGRPAAGFPPGAAPAQPETEATAESRQGKSESTVAALAAGLAAANPEAKRQRAEEVAKNEEEAAAKKGAIEGGSEHEASASEGGEGGAEPSG